MLLGWVSLLAILQTEPMSPLVRTERSRFAREVAAEVVVPIFAESGERAAAVLKVQRVTRDLQKRGLFRIGSLPCVRFEGVVLEVRDQEVLTEAIASVPIKTQLLWARFEGAGGDRWGWSCLGAERLVAGVG